MAPSFDCVSNVLENGSHFESWDNQGDTQQTHLSLSFFAAEDDESLSVLLQKEPEFMPKQGYVERFRNRTLDLNARREAVNWILKGEDAKFIFDAHTIQRMELLVLSTLQWRMHSVTPFSFVDYFVSKAIERNNVTPVHLIGRAVELILNTVKVADMAEYKPSAIAAAAVLCAAEEVVPLEAAHYKRVLSSCSNVDKERMFGCYNLIQEIMIENSFTRSKKNQISGGSLSAAKTPTGVLDAGACFSSWDSDKTSATRTSSISVEPYAKRRKLNEFCSSVFVSEVQPC